MRTYTSSRVGSNLFITTTALLFALALAACGSTAASQANTAEAPAATAEAPAATAPAAGAANTQADSTEAATEATQTDATAATTEANQADPVAESGSADQATGASANSRLNLNEVTEDQLLSRIPGFGDRMVREFFEYRPYVSIQQFRKEIGKYVDETQVAEYERYVYVPVSPNDSDEATLQQIPGVDAAVAAQLVAGRPYASNAAFLEQLAQLVPAEAAATAAGYLEGE